MRAPRAVLCLLVFSSLAACERGRDPITPDARPSLDSGGTIGSGSKSDSTSVGTASGDSTTVSTADGGVTIGGGGK